MEKKYRVMRVKKVKNKEKDLGCVQNHRLNQ